MHSFSIHRGFLLFSCAGLGSLAILSLACGGGSTVEADDWVDEFCEAAEDFEDAGDDASESMFKIDMNRKGARKDVVDVIEDMQKELGTFKKAALKIGTPKLDSGKDVKKAVEEEFEAQEEGYKKLISAVKKLDEGDGFEEDLFEAFADSLPEPGFRDALERLASRKATGDAREIIDGIESDSGCASAAF